MEKNSDSNASLNYLKKKPIKKLPLIDKLNFDSVSENDVQIVNFSKLYTVNGKDLSQDYDSDIISNFIGHYGLWQFIWTFILSIFQLPNTFHIFAFVFQSAAKEFWCARPDNLKLMNITLWKNISQPHDACSILDLNFNKWNFEALQFDRSDNISSRRCTAFEYSNDEISSTIISEWNLVCDRQYLLSVVEMCFLAGAAVGSFTSGYISDKYGRKHTLMVAATIQCSFGTILAFSNSLTMYMCLRFIIGFASMTVTVVSFVLIVELVSGKWRTIIGILSLLPVAISYIITSGIAYLIRDWRVIQLVISAPWFVLLLIWYCVPESPRWLLGCGKIDELKKIIERASRMNNVTLPANYEKSLEAEAPSSSSRKQVQQLHSATRIATVSSSSSSSESGMSSIGLRTAGNIGDNTINSDRSTNTSSENNNGHYPTQVSGEPIIVVFSKEYRKITFLTLVLWFTLVLLYFGLTLHLSNLGGNIYMNTAIAGLLEAFSICTSVFVVLKLGIHMNLVIYMLVAGVACLMVNFIPDGNLWAVISLAMLGKCIMGASNAIVPTYTAQQYPTMVRNFGIGVGNFAAGVALIVVPYLWLLEHIQIYLPMTIMGFCGIIGAISLMMMKKNPHNLNT